MKTKLMNDLKEAMKNKDNVKKNTIQMIRSAILLEEKNKQKELSNDEIEKLIITQKKQRTDALSQFEKAGREDLIEQTRRELEIIKQYLPEQMDEGDIANIIDGILFRNPEINNFGQVMKLAKEEIGNHADYKLVSEVIKEYLSK